MLVAGIWYSYYRDPQDSKAVSQAELGYVKCVGGVGDTVCGDKGTEQAKFSWNKVGQLLSHRQVWGMFIGQFSVNTTLFLFLTWFPTYLINGRGLTWRLNVSSEEIINLNICMRRLV